MRQSKAFCSLILVILNGLAHTALASENEAKIGALYVEDIMQDVLEVPRFKIDFAHEPLAESKLPKAISQLRKKTRSQKKQKAVVTDNNSGLPNTTNLAYEPLVVNAGKYHKFFCQVPQVDSKSILEQETKKKQGKDGLEQGLDSNGLQKELDVTVERGLELLDSLKAECILFSAGWWAYEYCHGKHVRQFHKFEPDGDGIIYSIEYMLGSHEHLQSFPTLTDGSGSTKDKAALRDTRVSRVGRKRFLTQVWGGGTECDLTGRQRQIEIQFHCDPNGPERVVMVEEIMTCQYVMIINTPRLCADPLFYDTLASTAYSIKCRQVVADDLIKPEAGEEQGRQKNNHIQPNAAIGDADDTQETGGSESGYYEMVAETEADAGDESPDKHTGIRSPEKATSSNERRRPQVVLSINDPNLATGHESEEQREVIRRALAIMYGDENLNVGFANASDNSDEEQEDTKAAEKSHLHDEL